MKKYTISWKQPLANWGPLKIKSLPQQKPEPEITNFAQAREVLAKIMSK